ncbi:unnamed protein product [Acanthoscelides obtectus]|uniref:Uncharacterized protein n=1 Tax=Acanthoscelides obtectus TaxID=200917 RepID=A0A9P0P310_ACAOB|nr:unnamed protein product [Acanthoscelides obtectus]CAK1666931.1 hypothetical protein AOBTE_LOCUS25559 [Acanthoscelides obtectus]
MDPPVYALCAAARAAVLPPLYHTIYPSALHTQRTSFRKGCLSSACKQHSPAAVWYAGCVAPDACRAKGAIKPTLAEGKGCARRTCDGPTVGWTPRRPSDVAGVRWIGIRSGIDSARRSACINASTPTM